MSAERNKARALELIDRGITVNVVAPAATETAMLVDPDRAVLPPETPPLGRRIRHVVNTA